MTADERNAELRNLSRAERTPPPVARTDSWESDAAPDVHDEPTRRVTVRVVAFLVLLLLVLGGAAAAVGFYARGSYYVGLDAGRVVIFKGRPGGLLWFSPTVEEVTDLTQASVPPARVDAVVAGHPAASLDDAKAYVRSLEATPGAVPPVAAAPPTPPTTDPPTTAPPTSTP